VADLDALAGALLETSGSGVPVPPLTSICAGLTPDWADLSLTGHVGPVTAVFD
jgi:hypothetical protein